MFFTKILKVLVVVPVVLLGFYSSQVSATTVASTTPTIQVPSQVVEIVTPQVEVSNVTTDKTSYTDGNIVNGSFIMDSLSDSPISDVYYKVYLVGDFTPHGLAQISYAEQIFNPIYLGANESKYIPFQFTLPKGVTGTNLAIEVRAFLKDQSPLGWDSAKISISGTSQLFTLVSSDLVNGTTSFADIEAGPTIDPKSDLRVITVFKNTTKSSITFFPHVTLLNKGDIKTTALSVDGDQVTVASGATTSATIVLPTTMNPGIYVGTMSFRDIDGTVHAQNLELRYIIRGLIANIADIRSDKTEAMKGDTINLSVDYTGAPSDISNFGKSPDIGDAKLTISLYNEKNDVVATQSMDINLNSPVYGKPVQLQANTDAKALRVEGVISKNGMQLSKTSINLSPNYDQLAKTQVTAPTTAQNSLPSIESIMIGIGVVLLLILFLISLMLRKSMKAPYMVLLILIGASLYFIAPSSAQAGFDPPHINIGKPGKYLKPGQKFYIYASASQGICTNRSLNISLSATYNGSTQSSSEYSPEEYNHDKAKIIQFMDILNAGPFTAPTKAGTYSYRLDALAKYRDHGSSDSYNNQDITSSLTAKFSVVEPTVASVCPNLSGTYTSIPTGMIKNASGNCVPSGKLPDQKDYCPNIDGIQYQMPDNTYFDSNTGICISYDSAIDMCPNIPGIQTSIPAGDVLDATNNCVSASLVVPPNNLCDASLVGTDCSTGGTCANQMDGTYICTNNGLVCQQTPGAVCQGAVIKSFTALPSDVKKGGQCTLSWDTAGATSCKVIEDDSATPLQSNVSLPSGTVLSNPIMHTTRYNLICTGVNKIEVTSQPALCRIITTVNEN